MTNDRTLLCTEYLSRHKDKSEIQCRQAVRMLNGGVLCARMAEGQHKASSEAWFELGIARCDQKRQEGVRSSRRALYMRSPASSWQAEEMKG